MLLHPANGEVVEDRPAIRGVIPFSASYFYVFLVCFLYNVDFCNSL